MNWVINIIWKTIKERSIWFPKFHWTMYFAYWKWKRDDIQAKTTFDAIKSWERTSSTWDRNWCEKAKKWDVVRFYNSNKVFVWDFIDVVLIEDPKKIELYNMNEKELEEWSKNEWWSILSIKEKWLKYFNKPIWNIRFNIYKK